MPDDQKISALPAAGPLTGAERLPLVQGGVNVGAALAALLPAGTMQMYAGAVAPDGWLLCDGSAVSRADHAALFGAVGTAWGAGDGSTTFNVPDLRGRAPIGAGTGAGLTARTLGGVGGDEKTDLTGLEFRVSATGTISATATNGAVLAEAVDWGGDGNAIYAPAGTSATIALGGLFKGDATGTAGNLPPYAAVNFIIRG
jgi:microcystin-dependent protein